LKKLVKIESLEGKKTWVGENAARIREWPELTVEVAPAFCSRASQIVLLGSPVFACTVGRALV